MKVRNVQRHGDEKIELQMTPMIDIVFQLLVFFIMTFKIIAPEGDFSIRMPQDAPSQSDFEPDFPPIKVRLRASSDGELAGIYFAQRAMEDFEELRKEIRGIVGDDSGPGSFAAETEVEFDCDYNLKYENVILAITAVSGYTEGGRIIKLIEKIKFSPPRPQP